MKIVIRVLLWIGGISLFILLISMAGEHDREDCEVRIAKELNTTAVYINGHCMVKGYGRFDGR
ncbi:TPA: hypothetical protein PFE31_002091 [Kluyvera ascorbata]|nr:hypothetical protein [Kluyvera ascorbata]